MFPEVWRRLTSGGHNAEPARLDGYIRGRVRGEVYPAVTPGDGAVEGVLYHDLDDSELEALDRFEGGGYNRTLCYAALSNGETVAAWVYVLAPESGRDLDGDWDPEWFERQGLPRFLKNYRGFNLPSSSSDSPL
jgi:gamma-glutamylcyclotransferase (GGCT)/AIG2-like uncharacterized protein YtfP